MVMARSERGGRPKARGSEMTSAPAGTVVDGCVEKVRGVSVDGSMAPLAAGLAMCAEVMTSAVLPNALDKRTRMRVPPMDTWTIWRKVVSAKSGFGGATFESTGCGEQAHVPIQISRSAVLVFDRVTDAVTSSRRRRHNQRERGLNGT